MNLGATYMTGRQTVAKQYVDTIIQCKSFMQGNDWVLGFICTSVTPDLQILYELTIAYSESSHQYQTK